MFLKVSAKIKYVPFFIFADKVDILFYPVDRFANITNVHNSWSSQESPCKALNSWGHGGCKHHGLRETK